MPPPPSSSPSPPFSIFSPASLRNQQLRQQCPQTNRGLSSPPVGDCFNSAAEAEVLLQPRGEAAKPFKQRRTIREQISMVFFQLPGGGGGSSSEQIALPVVAALPSSNRSATTRTNRDSKAAVLLFSKEEGELIASEKFKVPLLTYLFVSLKRVAVARRIC